MRDRNEGVVLLRRAADRIEAEPDLVTEPIVRGALVHLLREVATGIDGDHMPEDMMLGVVSLYDNEFDLAEAIVSGQQATATGSSPREDG